jgi:hypothetical protein
MANPRAAPAATPMPSPLSQFLLRPRLTSIPVIEPSGSLSGPPPSGIRVRSVSSVAVTTPRTRPSTVVERTRTRVPAVTVEAGDGRVSSCAAAWLAEPSNSVSAEITGKKRIRSGTSQSRSIGSDRARPHRRDSSNNVSAKLDRLNTRPVGHPSSAQLRSCGAHSENWRLSPGCTANLHVRTHSGKHG